jgi:hypothetical protein
MRACSKAGIAGQAGKTDAPAIFAQFTYFF